MRQNVSRRFTNRVNRINLLKKINISQDIKNILIKLMVKKLIKIAKKKNIVLEIKIFFVQGYLKVLQIYII